MKTLTLFTAVALFGTAVSAQSLEQIIKKARSQLAPEKTLEAVKTLRYEASVDNAEGPEGTLILVFKKPYMQYLEVETDAFRERTAVNGFEGWRERLNKVNPAQSGVLVLDPQQTKYLLSNAMENLYFFEGPEHARGGEIKLDGEETVRGMECWKVDFIYPSGLRYSRFFEKSTGKLVVTRTSNGEMEMVEKESLKSGGIKFPRVVETYKNGVLVRTVTFEKIEVNDPVEDSLFDFPSIPANARP